MKILYLASNPDTLPDLQIEKEVNLLRAELDKIDTAETIDLRVYSYLRVEELASILRSFQPDIIHFAAHGSEEAVVLAQAERGRVFLNGTMMADLLSSLQIEPALIVINACKSGKMAEQLANEKIFVIGTDAPLTNVGARTMAATLYHRLADASSLLDAFNAAAVMLRLVDLDQVGVKLYPIGSEQRARKTRIANPLRILASLPLIDDWLDRKLKKPQRGFDPEWPALNFGLAGVPPTARQTIFYTDDETVLPRGKKSIEEARCWLIEDRAFKGEIWMPDDVKNYGDMAWFASITTTDGLVHSAASKTVAALQRYYFDEEWRGPVPDAYAELIKKTIQYLAANDGSRRAR